VVFGNIKLTGEITFQFQSMGRVAYSGNYNKERNLKPMVFSKDLVVETKTNRGV